MKKILLWLLILVLSISIVGVFSFVGCRKEAAPIEEAVTVEEVEEEPTKEEASAKEVEEEVALTKDELYQKLYGDLNGAEINFLGWQGYDGGESIKPFLEKYNITMSTIWVTNNDEIFAKLKAGGGGRYDIVTPYHGIVPSFIENDLLEPLDMEKIPNYKDIFEIFKGYDWNKANGNIYAIPFTWGSTPLHYNADKIEEPNSWDVVLDPQYKGKIVVLDDPISAIIIAACWLGYEEHATFLTEEQLQQCYERLLEAKKNWRYIAPSFGDIKNALVSGEALICFNGWEPVAIWAQQEGVNIKSVVPKEGSFAFIDNLCIAKDAANINAAYAFINEMLDPETQASWGAELPTAVVNNKALQFMDEQQIGAFPYSDIQGFFTRATPYPPTPTESDKYATLEDWVEVWERVKTAE